MYQYCKNIFKNPRFIILGEGNLFDGQAPGEWAVSESHLRQAVPQVVLGCVTELAAAKHCQRYISTNRVLYGIIVIIILYV